jgi:hypothetical protein
MLGRSASQMSINRAPRHHAAWNKFVDLLKTEMSEDEIISLSLDTVKTLANHSGLGAPLDIAHIELAWGERQPQINNNLLQTLSSLNVTQTSGSASPPPQEVHEEPEQAKTPPVGTRKFIGRGGSTGASKSPASASKSPTPGSASKYGAVQSKVAQQVKITSPRDNSSSPKDSKFVNSGDPNGKIVRKDVSSRIDTGKVRRSTSFEEDEVICVEDMKDVFTRYAAFANGDHKEIDSSRFAKMIKECDLIDKLFTLREADVLFTKCKKSAADRRIPYHVFRMKLVPEMAAKKHCSIADIVKLVNHHGGPEIRRRPDPVPEPEPEEEEPAPVVQSPPPKAVKSPAKASPASNKVPQLRKV